MFTLTAAEAAEAFARFIEKTRPGQWPVKTGDRYRATISTDGKVYSFEIEVKDD